jgi:DNA-binding GntR family transcriptional regulator
LTKKVSGEEYQLSVYDSISVTAFDLSGYLGQSIKRGNAVAETTRVLREAILDGVIAPDTWLREETLTAIIGVSRTPVREALSRLEEEGLVARSSGSGARVTRLSLEDMSIVYLIRGSLESLAAGRVAERSSDEHIAEFRGLHEAMTRSAHDGDPESFSRLNVQFHHELSARAGNAYLARLLGTVEVAMRRFGARSYNEQRMVEVLGEHLLLVEALERRDGPGAAQAAESHAACARASALRRLLDAN